MSTTQPVPDAASDIQTANPAANLAAQTPVAPSQAGSEAPAGVAEADPTRVFSTSILISAIRCTLTYVIFPWVMPLLGMAGNIGPVLGSVVGIVAIGFNIASIRRFQLANHRWKWPITVLNSAVIVLLLVLLATDLGSL